MILCYCVREEGVVTLLVLGEVIVVREKEERVALLVLGEVVVALII